MRRFVIPFLLLAVALLIAGAAFGQSSATTAPPQTPPAPPPSAADVLYEDASAQSSATITQILPNSNTSLMTLGAVRKIRVQQEVLVVEWGTTATTLLPRQYVGSITVNKRADAAH